MNSRKTLTIITAISLILGSYRSIAQTAEELFPKGLQLEEVKGELGKAIEVYQTIVTQFSANRPIASKALIHIGLCNEKLGNTEARKAYERVLRDYPDQTEMVALAKTKLTQLSGAVSESTLQAEQSFKLAGDLYKEIKYESAITEYEKVIQMLPKSSLAGESLFWIGQCQFKDGNYPGALLAFETILKEYPKSSVVPVTELMIAQTKQASVDTPKKSPVQWIDDKTMLDPRTGIKYTKINSLSGKNDIIDFTAYFGAEIEPNNNFFLYTNKIIPFDNSEITTLADDPDGLYKLSPDGSKVAWESNNGIMISELSLDNGHILKPPTKVANLESEHILMELAWSPDQKWLLVKQVSNIKTQGQEYLNVSILDGSSKIIKKIPSGSWTGNATVTRNGKNILFKSVETMHMFNTNGSKSIVITDSLSMYGGFSVSPDNKWLMSSNYRGPVGNYGTQTLYRFSDKQRMDFPTLDQAGAVLDWSQKSNKILLYQPSYDLKYSLKVVSPYGGPSSELQKSLNRMCRIISWSPDGKSVIAMSVESPSLISFPIDNSPSKEFTVSDQFTYQGFSPDFSKVCVLNSTQLTIFPQPLLVAPFSLEDGKLSGPPMEILNKIYRGFSHSWSPDGSKIAVVTSGQIWICPVNENKPVKIGITSTTYSSIDWSPDGRLLGLTSSMDGKRTLRIISSKDGSPVYSLDSVKSYDWSTDNTKLAVAFTDGTLASLSRTNWEIHKLTDWSASIKYIGIIKWSPDGKFLAFQGTEEDSRSYSFLFVINANGGKVTELGGLDLESKDDLKWSPDSKWIAYDSWGSRKIRPEGTLWEADLTDYMKTLKPGPENGYTPETDINALAAKMPAVKPDGTFTDARDGRKYTYKKIGEQTWMAENLAYLPQVHSKNDKSITEKRFNVYGYEGTNTQEARKLTNYTTYGVLYNWPAAMNCDTLRNSDKNIQGICPDGWHLPSDAEWVQLEVFLGMDPRESYLTGTRKTGDLGFKLRSSTQWNPEDDLNTGSSGFEALPGGLGGFSTGEVQRSLGNGCYFWTSTGMPNMNKAAARFWGGTLLSRGEAWGKSITASVRCIKDK